MLAGVGFHLRSPSNLPPVVSISLAETKSTSTDKKKEENLPEEKGIHDKAGLTGQVGGGVSGQIIGFSA